MVGGASRSGNRRASTSDTVRVSPALIAMDTGRFAILAERIRARECPRVARHHCCSGDLDYDVTREIKTSAVTMWATTA